MIEIVKFGHDAENSEGFPSLSFFDIVVET